MEPKEIFDMVPSSINDNLRKLLAKIISGHMDNLRADGARNQVSLPKLKNVDWRVDVISATSASSENAKKNVPTVIVQLEVESLPTHVSKPPEMQNINFEMDRGMLDLVLQNLSKIQTQLQTIE
eukprot:CAMPEP_0168509700 /NCGR_PEP_ID=MMETSP0405-20121227/957_1 /TAXON_ID=498012 /ORGANISM="Trichosphaerium sp, Strain Am-I-7 wt" /LENGTH=123 /DNA_ID=CAMNT_0008527259 /DNA_START=241 /DNA_END=612 /DNA_ORIENTATION=-